MYIDWDEDLETGIEVIDAQHMKIVEFINRLYDAAKLKDRVAAEVIFEEVVNYTLTHFTFEESIMEHANYPHFVAHREVHRLFAKRVEEYRTRLDSGEDVAKQLLSELRIWLTNHIKHDDKDYTQVVLQHLHGKERKGWLRATAQRLFGSSAQ